MFLKKIVKILSVTLAFSIVFNLLFIFDFLSENIYMLLSCVVWLMYMPFMAMKTRAFFAFENISKKEIRKIVLSTTLETSILVMMFLQMVLTKHIVMLIVFSVILIGFQSIDYYLVVILDDKIVIGKNVLSFKNDSKEKLILSGCYTTIFTLVVAFILLICLIDNILTQSIISGIFLLIVYILLEYTKKAETKNYLFIKMDFLIFILYFLLVKNKVDSFTPISIFTFFGLVILYPYFKHVSNTMKKYLEINKE